MPKDPVVLVRKIMGNLSFPSPRTDTTRMVPFPVDAETAPKLPRVCCKHLRKEKRLPIAVELSAPVSLQKERIRDPLVALPGSFVIYDRQLALLTTSWRRGVMLLPCVLPSYALQSERKWERWRVPLLETTFSVYGRTL